MRKKNMLFRFAAAWLLCTFSAGAAQEPNAATPNTRQEHVANSPSPNFPPPNPGDEEWEDEEEDEEFIIDKSEGAREGLVFLATFYSLLGLMFAWAARTDREYKEKSHPEL